MDEPVDPLDAAEPADVPGLHFVRRLGVGAHAQVWLATEPDTGEQVAVKVALDDGKHGGARLAREAELLARIDHPHVLRLRRVEPTPDGLALVLDHAEGGSLAELVAVRGGLDPGETTTVVVPIARALAALHGLGLVHGDVSAANVLFTADGRPLLADLGVAADLSTGAGDPGDRWGTPGWTDPSPAGAGPSPVGDSWGLGALIRFCLTGDPAGRPDPGSALAAIANACAATDPAARPTAREVSRAVWDACPPQPVRLLGRTERGAAGSLAGAAELTRRIRVDAIDRVAVVAGGRPDGAVGRPRRVRVRRLLAVAAGVLLLAGMAVAGATRATVAELAMASPSRVPSRVPSSPASGVPSPLPPARAADDELAGVLATLAASRARALTLASEAALADVDQPGSPAMAQDLATLRRLVGSGLRLRGLSFQVRQARLVGEAPGRWTVQAQVSTSAHRQLDVSGRQVAVVPAGQARPVTLELVRAGAGWRVLEVTTAT